jgi:hypothetical protein
VNGLTGSWFAQKQNEPATAVAAGFGGRFSPLRPGLARRVGLVFRAIIDLVKARASTGENKSRSSRAATSAPPSKGRQSKEASRSPQLQRIFLLSPANAAGLRGNLIVSGSAKSPLAQRLRETGVTLGEIFTFISGLYFRGKLTYAKAFVQPPAGLAGVYVITACGGLIPADTLLNADQLREISCVPIDAANPRYRVPLERDARLLCGLIGKKCEVVLLGSIATPKYVEPLLGIFGERLLFPSEFIGRGDMSRGGLMLRCAREGVQLTYVPVATAVRHGAKPPKLPKLPRTFYLQAKNGAFAAE